MVGKGSRLKESFIRKVFKGPLVLNQDYTQEAGQADLDSGVADAIAWGRLWIANPDLVERFRNGKPLAKADRTTFYTGHGDDAR